jgi:general nucleoside transport system ATP-binding protein
VRRPSVVDAFCPNTVTGSNAALLLSAAMPAPVVAMRNITRRFGGTVANDDVTFELQPGEIHALVGENGAGKTTLMRVLYGMLGPHSGRIEVEGRAVRVARPADAIRLGLGMVHQHFVLVDPMSVAENVTLGREPRTATGAFRRPEAERIVAELSQRYGLPVEPRATVASLSVGGQQRVEILKALHHGARVLILDEPTAVLAPQEVDELFRVLRDLRAAGTAIVLITHKLPEVQAIADRVTVMRAGRVAGGGPIAEFSNERIAELMVGHAPARGRRERTSATGKVLFSARQLEVLDDRGLLAVRGVSLALHEGEIVGIAGVEGNGQHELIECLAGLRPASGGDVRLAGGLAPRGARARFHAGLAHVPGDRLRRGMVGGMSVAENLVLGRQDDREVAGAWLTPRALARNARPLLADYDVRPPDPGAEAGTLSGGNQQKMVIAREISRGAAVMLVAHPTRGVDLGATAFIHERLIAARNSGRAILLVSSELTEILALSDRVLVMYGGRFVHETAPHTTDERTLGFYMTGQGEARG